MSLLMGIPPQERAVEAHNSLLSETGLRPVKNPEEGTSQFQLDALGGCCKDALRI